MSRDLDPPVDPRWPRLYQLPDGRWAERQPRECPRCHTRWFVPGDGPARVLVGSHKCRWPAVDGGVPRTCLCLTCQLEVCDPPLIEETCRPGEIRMMAPDHGLTAIEHAGRPSKPWWPEQGSR